MAEIAEDAGGGGGKGKKRAKKSSTRVDMTPMVDLGFLLLTFFVLTSTFSKPKVMSLVYPAKIDDPKQTPPEKVNNAITFVLTEDRIFYYEGEFFPKGSGDGPATQLTEAKDILAVRKLLADKNSFVIKGKAKLDADLSRKVFVDSIHKKKLIALQQDKKALKVLVKTDVKAKCKNFIDVVDELVIANIGMIAPVDIMKGEQELIDEKTK